MVALALGTRQHAQDLQTQHLATGKQVAQQQREIAVRHLMITTVDVQGKHPASGLVVGMIVRSLTEQIKGLAKLTLVVLGIAVTAPVTELALEVISHPAMEIYVILRITQVHAQEPTEPLALELLPVLELMTAQIVETKLAVHGQRP